MGKITKNPTNNLTEKKRQSYAEALFGNIKKILKIKDNYSNLLSKKIENIHCYSVRMWTDFRVRVSEQE